MKSRLMFLGLFIGMVLLDQAVKAWVRQSIPVGGSFGGKPWPGVFEVTLTYNKGIAFGMFQGAGVFMAPIAIAMAIGAGYYSFKHSAESLWLHSALGLIAAGAVGNLIDRVWLGHVTDMLWFRAIDFPVFNIADSCITVATVILVIVTGFGPQTKKTMDPATD
jgi:signal peptidase II